MTANVNGLLLGWYLKNVESGYRTCLKLEHVIKLNWVYKGRPAAAAD